MILNRCSIGSKLSNFFHFFPFCYLLNFVTLGFASAVVFCCLVITIFYVFDVTSVSSAVTVGAIAVATAGANPSVTKFSKEQNDLKMKELREFAANTEVGQYHLNLHVLGLNDYSTFAEMIKAYGSMARRFHPLTVVASRGRIE